MEGVVEQINLRLEEYPHERERMTSLENSLNARMNETRMNAIETRMNVQIVLTFAVWATIVGMLLVMMFRG